VNQLFGLYAKIKKKKLIFVNKKNTFEYKGNEYSFLFISLSVLLLILLISILGNDDEVLIINLLSSF
jgi:hypothetical protein